MRKHLSHISLCMALVSFGSEAAEADTSAASSVALTPAAVVISEITADDGLLLKKNKQKEKKKEGIFYFVGLLDNKGTPVEKDELEEVTHDTDSDDVKKVYGAPSRESSFTKEVYGWPKYWRVWYYDRPNETIVYVFDDFWDLIDRYSVNQAGYKFKKLRH